MIRQSVNITVKYRPSAGNPQVDRACPVSGRLRQTLLFVSIFWAFGRIFYGVPPQKTGLSAPIPQPPPGSCGISASIPCAEESKRRPTTARHCPLRGAWRRRCEVWLCAATGISEAIWFNTPAKYRKAVISPGFDKKLREICQGIEARHEIQFLEIGTEKDHVHFLAQSVPTYSPAKKVQIIKSITAKKMFEAYPEVKKDLRGGEFWTRGYYVGTVGDTVMRK
jgi:REP element-mobilizing transposase RayT